MGFEYRSIPAYQALLGTIRIGPYQRILMVYPKILKIPPSIMLGHTNRYALVMIEIESGTSRYASIPIKHWYRLVEDDPHTNIFSE